MAGFDFRSLNSDVVGLSFGLVVAGIQKLWRGYQEHRADTWPTTYGRIDRASLDSEHKNVKFKCYYTYRVGAESFVGKFLKTFEDAEEAQAWQDALSKKQVAVRYDPENPSRSRLRDSDLETIVQSAAPVLHPHLEKQAGGAKVLVAKVCSVLCVLGLAITIATLVEVFVGRTLVSPEVERIVGWAALPVFFFGLWIGRRDKLSAKLPGWMKFLGYALLYYAIFASFLGPARNSRSGAKKWVDVRYQLFLYFSALEACYLRLLQKQETSQDYGALTGPSLK